jgi:hypothetical protein
MGTVVMGLLATVLLASQASAAAVTLAGSGYPAPGGNNASNNGVSPKDGTRVITYSNFDPSAYDSLYYVIGDYPGPTFSPLGPKLTTDGTTDLLSFNASASNLANGVARWTGTSAIPRIGLADLSIDTRFTLTVLDNLNNPLALTPAASIDGMPTSIGGALAVPSAGFQAYWLYEIATAGTNVWQTASTYYNNVLQRNPGFQLVSSVGGAFYSTAPVPLPAAVWLLLSGLGALGFLGRRKAA